MKEQDNPSLSYYNKGEKPMFKDVFSNENLLQAFKRYKEEVCSTCKAKCNEDFKGICVVHSQNGLGLNCIDYDKDETKIVPNDKNIEVTAKRKKPLMRNII